MTTFRRFVLAGSLALAVLCAAAQAQIDVSGLRGSSDTPPVQAETLEFDGNTATVELSLETSRLFVLSVDDPSVLYRVRAETDRPINTTLSAIKLDLNASGQATRRTDLVTDVAIAPLDQVAELPPTLFEAGDIYIALAAIAPVDVTLTVERVPATETVGTEAIWAADAIATGNDMTGPNARGEICMRPEGLRAGEPMRATLITTPGARAGLRVYSGDNRLLEQRRRQSPFQMTNLVDPNARICVSRPATEGAFWRLLIEPQPAPNDVAEPNAGIDTALRNVPVDGTPISGWIDSGDQDLFRLPSPGARQAYHIRFDSPVPREFCLYNDELREQECLIAREIDMPLATRGDASMVVSVYDRDGRPSQYRIAFEQVSFDPQTHLAEPNYREGMQPVAGESFRLVGRLESDNDDDGVYFDPGDSGQMFRFVIVGDTVDRAAFANGSGELGRVSRSAGSRRLVTPDMYFEPGLTSITLTGKTGDYKIIARPLGPPPVSSEREPNLRRARRVRSGEEIRGVLDTGDIDQFALFVARDSRVVFRLDVPAGGQTDASIYAGGRASIQDPNRLKTLSGRNEIELDLPAGEHLVELRPRVASPAEYVFSLTLVPPFPETLSDEVSLTSGDFETVRAFSLNTQTTTGTVEIVNSGETDLIAKLDTWFAEPGLVARFDLPDELAGRLPRMARFARDDSGRVFRLPPGERAVVDLALAVPPDLEEGDVTGAVLIRGLSGRVLARSDTRLVARSDAVDLSPQLALPAPASMIGGMNVAQTALGARWVASAGHDIDPDTGDYVRGNPSNAGQLLNVIDSVTAIETANGGQAGILSYSSDSRLDPILDLPGEDAIPLVGIGLANRHPRTTGIEDFAIDVSMDGRTWTEALTGTMTVWGPVQYFTFEEGIRRARYVRLRALNFRAAPRDGISLNRFEVIAAPGRSGLDKINIADPANGALVSGWRGISADRLFQIADGPLVHRPVSLNNVPQVSDFNLAITFKNQREAEVAAIELVFADAANRRTNRPYPRAAVVQASVSGPMGPWREVGRVELPEAPDASDVVRLELPEYERAQALKIEYEFDTDATPYQQLPSRIRVLERPEGPDYRSVLGLWGETRTAKTFEDQVTVRDVRADPETPEVLEPNQGFRRGEVEFETRVERWRVGAEDGANIISLDVQGSAGFEPSLVARVSGQVVQPAEVNRPEGSSITRYTFQVEPGTTLDLELSESQRSVVFLFDQSPSVAPFIPMIRRAITDFSDDMVPGRDALNFKALGREWGSEDWITDPVVLRRRLADYGYDGNSSGETALLEATEKLSGREGSRAIVTITDGDVDAATGLLAALKASRVRVFPIKISSGGTFGDPSYAQPVTLLWSGQTGGETHFVLKPQDISVAYARASARLLGPKPYAIRAETETRVLSPGQLEVVSGDADLVSPESMNRLIVFDASGSMLKRVGDERRITIARRALKGWLADTVTQGNAIGLRSFGGPPGSCETELVTPVEVNDLAALERAVDAITPQNNARTAIGAALLAAGDDLAGTDGQKSILLITDGEETCEGDPLAAIETLRERGVETRLDVVSFALDPEIDRAAFEAWARAGDGIYVDVASGEDLSEALARTVQIRFRVLSGPDVVATGAVDGPQIDLAPGEYTLEIDGLAARVIRIREGEVLTEPASP